MKINVENTEKLQAALDTVQTPRMTARLVDPAHITRAIKWLDKHLDIILPKKLQNGLEITLNENAQTFPGAYKGIPESTYVKLLKTSSGWFVTEIYRDRCGSQKFQWHNIGTEERREQIFIRTIANI